MPSPLRVPISTSCFACTLEAISVCTSCGERIGAESIGFGTASLQSTRAPSDITTRSKKRLLNDFVRASLLDTSLREAAINGSP
eukprot:31264-Pelagococcus_subviridis.AAC.14